MALISVKTKAPTGITITRSGNNLTVKWKINDANYSKGQSLQYKTNSGKWTTVCPSATATSKVISLSAANWYPTTTKKLLSFSVRIKGRRANYTKNSKTYAPSWSDWATKSVSFSTCSIPSLSAALSESGTNRSVFSWKASVSTTDFKPFVRVQYQHKLFSNCTETDGSKLSWSGSKCLRDRHRCWSRSFRREVCA